MGAAAEESARAADSKTSSSSSSSGNAWKINGIKVTEKDTPASVASRMQTEWNTRRLPQRLAVDAVSALTAGALVAPVITLIDKAIIHNASGKKDMGTSVRDSFSKMVFRPRSYFGRPFLLILMVYGGTYLTANTLDTFKSTTQNKPASTTTSGLAKFCATSSANLSLSLYKDSQFTKMFGTATSRPVPGPSYVLFAIRDCLTVFASFNLPPLIAPKLPMSEAAEQYVSRASVAQFMAPAAIQLVSTPFHLLGLDLYNRNGGTTFRERMDKVRLDWLKSSILRMCRIVPAFGVGGVVNIAMRKRCMHQLE